MRFLMLGAGGHARSVADALPDLVVDAVVLPDIGAEDHSSISPSAITEADLLLLDPAETRLVNGIGQMSAFGPRWDAQRRLESAGFEFVTVVHRTASVARSARLGVGAQVLAQTVIGPQAEIGAGSIVNSGAVVEHDCAVATGVHLGPGSVLCGDVRVGDGAMIGAGATIIPSRVVGAGAQLGAGSVLLDDLGDGLVAVGVPARSRR